MAATGVVQVEMTLTLHLATETIAIAGIVDEATAFVLPCLVHEIDPLLLQLIAAHLEAVR